jgi:cysteinyl-tRNA synthetase
MKHMLVLFAAMTIAGCAPHFDVDLRAEMVSFVKGISAYAKTKRPGFVVIPQNGHTLFTTAGLATGPARTDYLAAIDGVGREDLYYGYISDNVATPEADSEEMLAFLAVAAANGVRPLVIDYCSTTAFMQDSYDRNSALGYLSFAADERSLNDIPSYPAQPYRANDLAVSNLSQASNFLYHINPENYPGTASFVAALDATRYDVFVVDLFTTEGQLTAADVEALQTKPSGAKRLVVCYMSIGEAEDYRYYWQDGWKRGDPEWLYKENPDWPGNYKVLYWMPEWQAIVYGSQDAYLDRILAAGFDGVYLDIIDAYEYFEEL